MSASIYTKEIYNNTKTYKIRSKAHWSVPMKTAKELIDELTADGVSQSEIGAGTNIPQATISRIQTGKIADTKASNWNRINAFHMEHFSAKAEQAGPGDAPHHPHPEAAQVPA
ncbi:hypothetical protein phiE131_057 [Burkholderia phage phiE131]|nr:hypothetical protein phiE131_057 [Burkholderia phage phiE131]AYJ74393.1 hypothetical protein phiE058_057 [Burkholderia phage phiE058]